MSVASTEIDEHAPQTTRRRRDWPRRFLRTLARTGNVKRSARAAGIDHSWAYRRKKSSGRFADAWDRAMETYTAGATERAEAELRRRGIDGWQETTLETHRDRVGDVQRTVERTKLVKDTAALVAYLKAHHDAYRDRQEITHTTAPLVDPELQQAVLADPVASQLACDLAARIASLRQQQRPLPALDGPPPLEPPSE